MCPQTLSVIDNRTGKEYEIPIEDGTVRAMDLRQIKVSDDDFGLMTYDPAFTNTACCRSKITFIDGTRGILRYRGYPIDQLAETYSYLQIAHLILFGELPNKEQHDKFSSTITRHTFLNENIQRLISTFQSNASPISMVMSAVAAQSSLYPEAIDLGDDEMRLLQCYRLIATMPTIAAYIHRHKSGLPFVAPQKELSYPANFLNMTFKMTEQDYEINPVLEKALDVLFILHADHEQNCSANAMRSVGSSRPDLYAAATAAIGALSGPLHGGANEAVLTQLQQIASKDRVPGYIQRVKTGELRLIGFGHRVYKNYDPRAKIIKRMANEVFEITGSNPLLDVALELERIALQDDYFVSRKLYPNVDFYSGLIYQAMGFPTPMFPVLFAIGRTSGWVTQWNEMLLDKEQKIARPRQIYEGPRRRDLPTEKPTSAP